MQTTEASAPRAPNHPIRRFGESALGKLLMLGVLILILLIPVAQVRSLVDERMARRQEATHEISSIWSRSQVLSGPVVTLQTQLRIEQTASDGTKTISTKMDPIMVHPRMLELKGRVEPQLRNRGLFEVVVFESFLTLRGEFVLPELEDSRRSVLWDRTEVALGISDVRGIQEQVTLYWGDLETELQPGPGAASFLSGGIHARLPNDVQLRPGSSLPFELRVSLRGSGELSFLPSGTTTIVELESPWADPSFNGAFLPNERTVGEEGFTARWEIPAYGRNFPETWFASQGRYGDLEAAAFGVGLVVPADAYQQTDRAVKYAVLFILMTFGTFFLLELLSPVRLHAVQYLLVGFALSVFYVLLLALAEHVAFGIAYAVASAATVTLISVYARSILAGAGRARAVFGCLGLLYVYLYVLLQLEDYALLVGALGLFGALAWLMIATRNLDWFSLRFREAPGRA